MAGVERLMVVDHPLAANPEDQQGPGIVQHSSDFLRGYGISPQSTFVGGVVGFFMDPGIAGPLKGALVGSLASMLVNYLDQR